MRLTFRRDASQGHLRVAARGWLRMRVGVILGESGSPWRSVAGGHRPSGDNFDLNHLCNQVGIEKDAAGGRLLPKAFPADFDRLFCSIRSGSTI